MAYRPSPVDFPSLLHEVPREEQNAARATNGILLLLTAVATILVSLAYAREYVIEDDVRHIWKPGIGFGIGLLIGALAIWSMYRRMCLVRRGDWIAIYEIGKRKKVISISEIVLIELSKLQTVRLSFASVVCLLIGGIGLPAYLGNGYDRLVYVTWFIAALIIGAAVALDIVVGRLSSVVVKVDGEELTLRRRP